MEERNKRKAEIAEKKEQASINELVNALRIRGIATGIKGKRDGGKTTLDLSSIEPCHPAAYGSRKLIVLHTTKSTLFIFRIGKRVHLVGDALVWPVLFLYPEYGETDFVQEFHEDSW